MSDRFDRAIAAMDAANAGDPDQVSVDTRLIPGELAYSQWMTKTLSAFAPDSSEHLRLAARAQHIRRWVIPRSSYPEGRIGYHRWRSTLYAFHAEQAGQILREAGYEDSDIVKVQSLIRKEHLKSDPEAQTLEDVACLVFLEHEFSEFLRKHSHEKMVAILQKTWKKMSAHGHQAATEMLPKLPIEARDLVEEALRD